MAEIKDIRELRIERDIDLKARAIEKIFYGEPITDEEYGAMERERIRNDAFLKLIEIQRRKDYKVVK